MTEDWRVGRRGGNFELNLVVQYSDNRFTDEKVCCRVRYAIVDVGIKENRLTICQDLKNRSAD